MLFPALSNQQLFCSAKFYNRVALKVLDAPMIPDSSLRATQAETSSPTQHVSICMFDLMHGCSETKAKVYGQPLHDCVHKSYFHLDIFCKFVFQMN